MTPVRSQKSCVVLKVSEPAIRSVASRSVRKSRGEQATVKHKIAKMKMKAACRRRILSGNCNQTRASARQERTFRYLVLKFGGPSARNRCLTGGALAVSRHAVFLHQIALPPDQHLAALMTACIFQITDPSRQVPGINVS